MAKGKGKKNDNKKQYISNGLVPSITRSVVLGMRRDSRTPIDSMMRRARSDSHKNKVISRPQGAAQRILAEKYKLEFQEQDRVYSLISQYRHVGLTEGAVIQALRTGWEGKLIEKFMAKAKTHEDKVRRIMQTKRVTREEATMLAQGKKLNNPLKNLRA